MTAAMSGRWAAMRKDVAELKHAVARFAGTAISVIVHVLERVVVQRTRRRYCGAPKAPTCNQGANAEEHAAVGSRSARGTNEPRRQHVRTSLTSHEYFSTGRFPPTQPAPKRDGPEETRDAQRATVCRASCPGETCFGAVSHSPNSMCSSKDPRASITDAQRNEIRSCCVLPRAAWLSGLS